MKKLSKNDLQFWIHTRKKSMEKNYFGRPSEHSFRQRNIRLSPLWIVHDRRFVLNFAASSDNLPNEDCEFLYRMLFRVAQIHRQRIVAIHEEDQSLHQIRNVLEGPRLCTVPIHLMKQENMLSPPIVNKKHKNQFIKSAHIKSLNFLIEYWVMDC